MPESLELFSTSQCPKCRKLAKYLESKDIHFVKRVIDEDPEAETDALMLNIFAAPALKKGDKLLRVKDLFPDGEELNEDKVNNFV
ncbi:MAG: glutaredoxin family protein [Promethearchaeota archaeon]